MFYIILVIEAKRYESVRNEIVIFSNDVVLVLLDLIYFSMVGVNVLGSLNVSQILAKKMIDNNIRGSIVNISSEVYT